MLAADSATGRDSDLLMQAVREAGGLGLGLSATELRDGTKNGAAPGTGADMAVDALIRERLQSATPDYGWLSEESADDSSRLTHRRVWIVDPIDGTRAYLAGREDWSVSAALVEDGQPRIAAVFAPASDEFFFATAGGGATRNGATVAATGGASFDLSRIAGPPSLLDRMRAHSVNDRGAYRIGSLALRISRVAQGALDAVFVGGNSRDWDLAAADLLLREAGGRLTTLEGKSLRYNRPEVGHHILVGAGRERHERLVDHFRSDRVG